MSRCTNEVVPEAYLGIHIRDRHDGDAKCSSVCPAVNAVTVGYLTYKFMHETHCFSVEAM